MAVPKRRTSKSRKGMRRSHHRLTLPSTVKCANCSNLHVRHTICSECGHYRGKPILTAAEEI